MMMGSSDRQPLTCSLAPDAAYCILVCRTDLSLCCTGLSQPTITDK